MDSEGSCFHVPQQSRRDKLRVPPACSEEPAFQVLTPPAAANPPPPHNSNNLYDPSLDLHSHSNFLPLGGSNYKQPPPLLPDPPSSSVKDESAAGSNYVVAGGPFHGHLHLDSTRPPLPHHHHHQLQVQDIPLLYANSSSSSSSADFHHHQSLGYTQVGVGVGVGDVPVTTCNGQGLLSLSLSNSAPYPHALELNLPRFDASTRMRTSPPVPLGPFTGYASILKGSRFLKPAQELLDQLCDVGRGLHHASSIESSPSSPPAILHDPRTTTTNKIRLISLLEEVYRRYKFYFQQMQSIMSSFESVAGLGNAAPYASFALNTMSKHFRFLKNAITNQLHSFASKPPGNEGFSIDESIVYGNSERWVHCHSTIQSTGVFDHQPVWRPQRGLPERAVAVLRAWLFEHFLHPYPTDTDKQMLAKQTGLSRSQVSNWFINARVRLWKPMVEEIHMLETRQTHKSSSDAEDQNSSKPTNESQLSMNSPVCDRQAQNYSKLNLEDHSVKRSRNDELPSIVSDGSAEPVNLSSYDSLSRHENVDGGGNGIAAGGNSGVSLTLGLRQNNVAGLSELFPMNLARRFGVEPNNGNYMIDGFDGSNRQFGKSISDYMLHDFVG